MPNIWTSKVKGQFIPKAIIHILNKIEKHSSYLCQTSKVSFSQRNSLKNYLIQVFSDTQAFFDCPEDSKLSKDFLYT